MMSEHCDTSARTVRGPSEAPPPRPFDRRRLVASVLVNLLVPVVGYFLLRRYVTSDALALGLVAAIPVVRTLGVLMWRRRVDPIGVLAAIGLGVAVVVSLLSGGSALPLKFSEAMLTGVLGVACLVSVAVGKPLHLLFAKRGASRPLPPQAVHTSRVVTLVMGVAFLLHATVHVVFALTLPTGEYLIASRLVGWAVILSGGGVVYCYVRVTKRRSLARLGGTETRGSRAHRS